MQELPVLKNVIAENIDVLDQNLRDGSDCAGTANDECDRSVSNYLKQGKHFRSCYFKYVEL